MEHISCYIVMAILIAVIMVQNVIHKQERQDLYNRIMARDLPEYKASGQHRSVKNIIRKNTSEELKRRNTTE